MTTASKTATTAAITKFVVGDRVKLVDRKHRFVGLQGVVAAPMNAAGQLRVSFLTRNHSVESALCRPESLVVINGPWTCSRCTLMNQSDKYPCEACGKSFQLEYDIDELERGSRTPIAATGAEKLDTGKQTKEQMATVVASNKTNDDAATRLQGLSRQRSAKFRVMKMREEAAAATTSAVAKFDIDDRVKSTDPKQSFFSWEHL